MSSPPRPPARGASEHLWRMAAMGGTLASQVAAGAIIGYFLDRWLGTGPWLLVVFALAGVVVGMTTFIREAARESLGAAREAGDGHSRPPTIPTGPRGAPPRGPTDPDA